MPKKSQQARRDARKTRASKTPEAQASPHDEGWTRITEQFQRDLLQPGQAAFDSLPTMHTSDVSSNAAVSDFLSAFHSRQYTPAEAARRVSQFTDEQKVEVLQDVGVHCMQRPSVANSTPPGTRVSRFPQQGVPPFNSEHVEEAVNFALGTSPPTAQQRGFTNEFSVAAVGEDKVFTVSASGRVHSRSRTASSSTARKHAFSGPELYQIPEAEEDLSLYDDIPPLTDPSTSADSELDSPTDSDEHLPFNEEDRLIAAALRDPVWSSCAQSILETASDDQETAARHLSFDHVPLRQTWKHVASLVWRKSSTIARRLIAAGYPISHPGQDSPVSPDRCPDCGANKDAPMCQPSCRWNNAHRGYLPDWVRVCHKADGSRAVEANPTCPPFGFAAQSVEQLRHQDQELLESMESVARASDAAQQELGEDGLRELYRAAQLTSERRDPPTPASPCPSMSSSVFKQSARAGRQLLAAERDSVRSTEPRQSFSKSSGALRVCSHCFTDVAAVWSKCSCRTVRYCSKQCQKDDWNLHRKNCPSRQQKD